MSTLAGVVRVVSSKVEESNLTIIENNLMTELNVAER